MIQCIINQKHFAPKRPPRRAEGTLRPLPSSTPRMRGICGSTLRRHVLIAYKAANAIRMGGRIASSSRHLGSTTGDRPFTILGLQQVAVGSLNKQSLSMLWENVLGLEKVGTFKSEKENVDEDILRLGPEGSPYSIEVDIMSPIDPEKSPKVHSPPLNHIGLWVDDLDAAVVWMKDNGVRFTPGGIRKGASGHNVTFIHPKGNEDSSIGGEGVLIELVQAPSNVIEELKK